MKKYYLTLVLSLITLTIIAQGYEFGLVHISDNNFKVIAIADFDSGGNTDVSDFGFSLMLPAGTADVINISSVLGGKTPTLNEVDATALNTLTLGDGTRDLFFIVLSNVPSAIFSHTNGQQIDLLSFQVSNMPVSGEISILPNSDPIAIGLGSSVDSFYNSNIDATTTQDYFSGIASGMESIDFSTLGIEDNILLNDFNFYPNPTNGMLYLNGDVSKLQHIDIYSITGQHIMNVKDNFREINISSLQSAIYFMKLDTGEAIGTFKIVKE